MIDYGRLLGARAGPIGWILAIVAGLLLLAMALAFAVRKCANGACVPGGARSGYVPVLTGTSGITQTENGKHRADRSGEGDVSVVLLQHSTRVQLVAPLAISN